MLILSRKARKDIEHWNKTNKDIYSKIHKLLQSIKINPIEGIGKPERLRYYINNVWSRRIDLEHRLIYEIKGDNTIIISARYHY